MSYNPVWELYNVDQLKAAIAHAYTGSGAGTTSWAKINTAVQGMSDVEVYEMCSKLSDNSSFLNSVNQLYPSPVNGTLGNAVRVSETYASGSTAAIEAAEALNSNTLGVAAQKVELNIPASAVKTGNQVAFETGSTVVKTGSKLETVLGHAATALLGAGIALQLGVWFDGLLYNANPEFFDSHNMSEFNPQTWNESVIGQGLLQHANYPTAPVLVDKNGQMYCDETMYAMIAQYLNAQGAFGSTEAVDVSDVDPDGLYESYSISGNSLNASSSLIFAKALNSPLSLTYSVKSATQDVKLLYYTTTGVLQRNPPVLFACSRNPFTLHYIFVRANGYVEEHDSSTVQYVTLKDGTRAYYQDVSWTDTRYVQYSPGLSSILVNSFTSNERFIADLSYLLLNGTPTGHKELEGTHIYDQVPMLTPDMDLSQIINALKQQYPEMAQKELKNSVLQPDGTIVDHYYLPFSMPSGGTDTQPESKPTDKGVADPKNEPQSKRIMDTQIPPNTPTQPTDEKGTGNTPTVTTPTGAADALYAIYNPTLAEVKSLGAWLWSSSFIDQILKMFSSPMEAIISLHKIYGSPHTSGTQNIKVGYLNSGVSAKVVDQQYINIDCGTVNIRESYGSVFDYTPFSEISLYLPFIGIVTLDIADVMRGAVKIIYHIDVITGAVLAEVHVTRDAAGGVIYQYTGSCAEHFPLSAGSYVGVVAGMAGIVAGVAGSVASGGALAPALLGAGAGLGAAHTNIAKSGNFTANAGAMGIKKPYFIISRPQSAMAAKFEHMSGLGANTYCTLASLTGFVRVRFIHLGNITGATKEDLDYIESMLKKGVII